MGTTFSSGPARLFISGWCGDAEKPTVEARCLFNESDHGGRTRSPWSVSWPKLSVVRMRVIDHIVVFA